MNAVPATLNRATLPMRTRFSSWGIPGKDTSRLLLLLLAFTVVGVVGILFHPFTLRLRTQAVVADQWFRYSPIVYKVLTIAVAYLVGIMMHFDEQKFGYTSVAIGLPMRPGKIALQRIFCVSITVLLWMVGVAGLIYLLGPPLGTPRTWLPAHLSPAEREGIGLMRNSMELLIQVGAGILLGIAVGSLFRSLLVAAFAGPLLYIGSVALASNATYPGDRAEIFNVILLISMPVSLFMIYKGQHRIFERPFEQNEVSEVISIGSTNIRPSRWRTPMMHSAGPAMAANVVFAAAMFCIGLVVSSLPGPGDSSELAAGYVGLILTTLLGVSWISDAERCATGFLTYQLPLDRPAFLRRRLLPLLPIAVLTGLGFGSMLLLPQMSRGNGPSIPWVFFVILIPFVLATAVGAYCRLFFASRLVATISSLLIVSFQLGMTGVILDDLSNNNLISHLLPAYCFATGATVILLVLFFTWAAFCRSRVLEQSGRVQGLLGIASSIVLCLVALVIIFSPLPELYLYLKLSLEGVSR